MRALILLFTLCMACSGHAQNYPSRTITLLCGFPAGSGADVVLRALAHSAGKHLGQELVVENRPGGAGTLAAGSLLATKHSPTPENARTGV